MKRSPQRKAVLRRPTSASARLQDRLRKRRRHLFLERLEDRSLLATMIWSGAGGDNRWSTPGNWVGGAVPQQEDNLIFPAGALNTTNVNDLTGMRFRTITVSSSSYNISGNAITLLEGLTYNGVGTGASFSVPLALGGNATF